MSTFDIRELDLDPYSTENLTDPYPMHQQVRESGPVVRFSAYPRLVACGRHADVHAVLNDHATFISSAGVGMTNLNHEPGFRPKSLIQEADPPLHGQSRGVLSRILSAKAMAQMREQFAQVAEQMVSDCVAKGSIDGIADLAQRYPLQVFPDAVGLQQEDRDNLLLYGDMVFNSTGPKNALVERSSARHATVSAWIMGQCQREKLRPGGFGDQIYQAADAGKITHEQAPMLVRSFLSAGVDTTVSAIGNALFAFAQHPDQWARLHAEPALARQAFDEALRWESPVQTGYRTTSRDTQISGAAVPGDTKVLVLLAAANRDPRKWTEPDRFDIARGSMTHLAFGTGIHGCVGQLVARLEGELILAALARRVRRIEPAAPHTRRLNNALRVLAQLPLRLTPV